MMGSRKYGEEVVRTVAFGLAEEAQLVVGAGDVVAAGVDRGLVAQEQHGEAAEVELQTAALDLMPHLGKSCFPISAGRDQSWLLEHQLARHRSCQPRHLLPML